MAKAYSLTYKKQFNAHMFTCPVTTRVIESKDGTKLSEGDVLQHIQKTYCDKCEENTSVCTEFFNRHLK